MLMLDSEICGLPISSLSYPADIGFNLLGIRGLWPNNKMGARENGALCKGCDLMPFMRRIQHVVGSCLFLKALYIMQDEHF